MREARGGLRELNDLVATAELEALTALAAALAAAAAHAATRCLEVQGAPKGADRLLTAKAVAEMAGVSTSWVYENARDLPFTRRLGRALRFSERGLRRWIEAQKA